MSETLTFGRPSCKICILSGKGVFPLWPLSEQLFVLIGNYVKSRPSAITYVGAAHSILGILSSIAIGCNKLHSLQQSNSTNTTNQRSKTHRSQPLHTQVPKLTGRRPCTHRCMSTHAARFVGRSWNAKKKRQIPFDSWWCAYSKNVIFIKIGRWPFSKIALLCPTRYFFR